MTDVMGRTAFISGGANGIGLGIARACGRAGVKLALADIDAAALVRSREELQQITQVETYILDVRDRSAFATVASAVERALGPVSLLFNSAGVAAGAPPAKMSFELWDWGMDINLGGVINGVQTFLPGMIGRGQGGHIVNTTSGAGLAAVTTTLYTTAKYGVVGMSESLNRELTAAGVGVSLLCHGPVATDIVNGTVNASPNVIGEMVLAAVRENRLYIHTDRAVEGAIRARTQAILDALPSA